MFQVLNLIPKEGDGESFVDALARVRRCLGGEGATDNADSDSDLEVVTESVTVSLRCPWIQNENCWKVQALCSHGLF